MNVPLLVLWFYRKLSSIDRINKSGAQSDNSL